jgi:nucleotide-binding universal stress UspA family protein
MVQPPAPALEPAAGACRPRPFRRIVCVLEDGRETAPAVAQSAVLAAGGAGVCFLSACRVGSAGLTEAAIGSAARAVDALAGAARRAQECGVHAGWRLVRRADTLGAVREHVDAYDLVILGAPETSGAGARPRADTLDWLVSSGRAPLLVARTCPLGDGILVVTDGQRPTRRALTLGRGLAEWLPAPFRVLGCPGASDETGLPTRHLAGTGAGPGATARGFAGARELPAAVVAAASAAHAGLIVVGGTGRSGADGWVEAAQRIARVAPCSVLVVPRRG